MKITEEYQSPIGDTAQPARTIRPQSFPSQPSSPQSSNVKTAASSQIIIGSVAPPVETKTPTVSAPQEYPISSQELRDAFNAIQRRLDSQDQAIQGMISQQQSQANPPASSYGYANMGAIEQQQFPSPQAQGGQVSGKDILSLIMPFIQPQNPTESLLQQFLTSSIQGAMRNQEALQNMTLSIAQAVSKQAMGIKEKGLPPHDHQVRHRTPATPGQ